MGLRMFSLDEMEWLHSLVPNYSVLVSNDHDIRLLSKISGHEWLTISPYDGGSCEVLPRHSDRDPFHHQRGRYRTLFSALEYIKQQRNAFRSP